MVGIFFLLTCVAGIAIGITLLALSTQNFEDNKPNYQNILLNKDMDGDKNYFETINKGSLISGAELELKLNI